MDNNYINEFPYTDFIDVLPKADQEKNKSDSNQKKDSKHENIDFKKHENMSGKSLRQFYRYKNKIVFKESEPNKKSDETQSQADEQSNKLFDTYIKEGTKNREYFESNKPIKHSEDPEQEKTKTQQKKKKTTTIDGSSFRHEEFKKRDFFHSLRCISNKTFLGHSQCQILLMFIVFDLVVILGILVFHFRGDAQKLLPIPTSIKSKQLTIGNIIIKGASSNDLRDNGIISDIELNFNSSLIIGKSRMSQEEGVTCNKFISDGSLNIGNIIFDHNPSEKKIIIDTKNETLILSGHFNAGDVYIQNSSEFGGLIFINETCINCVTDFTRLTSELLETNNYQFSFKKLNLVPKLQLSMINDDSVLIFGDELSYACLNDNNLNSSCYKIISKDLYPVTAENFIKNNIANYGYIIHAQEFFNNQIISICKNKKDRKAVLLIDDKLLFEYNFYPEQAFIVPTLENSEIIQILTTGNKIYIYKLDSIFNSNDILHNSEKIIDSTYGKIFKLEAFLNYFGDIIVFAQTEKGVISFSIFPSVFNITSLELRFPDFKLFDAANRDGDNIIIAGAKEDGNVLLGRCLDNYCEKIKMFQKKPFLTDEIEFIGISLNENDKPTVSLSKEGMTMIINCNSFLCEDISNSVWI